MIGDDVLARAIKIENLDSSVEYYVINHGFGAYLKLGQHTDSYGDREAYIHEGDRGGDDSRYRWTVTHDQGDGTVSFLNNSRYGGFLFQGNQTDSDGDRKIWGHNAGHIDGSKGDRYKFQLFQVSDTDSYGNVFYLRTKDGHYVKGANSKGSGDDRGVFAQPNSNENDRFKWVIIPVS
ncbi:hypothetical protein [Burkholderia plantarii]|uniref:hypothetical protein n=1 Tax=Burkholderia plantarii TaxID=41899 RepID=UPI000B2F3499|nr:hypothetical protein [Burkholderia plantarii]GLZ22869.1 hypothetical protein Bpla01_63980 [Burkholderia plantarii]